MKELSLRRLNLKKLDLQSIQMIKSDFIKLIVLVDLNILIEDSVFLYSVYIIIIIRRVF